MWCPGLQIKQQQWRKPRPRGQEVRQDLGDPGKTLLTTALVSPGNQGGTVLGGGRGRRQTSPGKHCPFWGGPWESRERSSTEDPGSGPRQVTVTRPLGRPTPWNAVNSTHARRSQASEWTHSRSGGARRLRWSLGCLTLQGPARPPRWVRASFPSVLKRRGSLGGSRPPPRPLPLSSKVRGPSRLAAQPQHVPDIPHSSPTFPSVPCRWAEAT